MSFLLKGGYYATCNKVLNISLKRTDMWTNGLILVKTSKYSLSPKNDNIIELVKYDDTHALLLNNAIIYEDKKLFTYMLDLQGFRPIQGFRPMQGFSPMQGFRPNEDRYDFLECESLSYSELKTIIRRRCLN